jgi:hypothetical protein
MKETIKEIGRNLKDPWYWAVLILKGVISVTVFVILTKLFTNVWIPDLL